MKTTIAFCLLVFSVPLTVALIGCEQKIEVPPGASLIEGTVQDKRGPCHWVLGADGKVYSLRHGVLVEIPVAARVRIIGTRAKVQDCPGSTVIDPLVPVKQI